MTQGLTTCQGFAKSEQVIVNEDGLERRWKQRRGAYWRTYDAKNFDEWTTAKERSPSKQHRIRSVARQVVWGPWTLAREFYDTYEHALTLGAVSDAGLCLNCGGKRRPRACACPDEHLIDLLPVVEGGCCVECGKKRKESPTCACGPSEAVHQPSAGMILWEQTNQARKRRPVAVEIPETDDTPGVVVETTAA